MDVLCLFCSIQSIKCRKRIKNSLNPHKFRKMDGDRKGTGRGIEPRSKMAVDLVFYMLILLWNLVAWLPEDSHFARPALLNSLRRLRRRRRLLSCCLEFVYARRLAKRNPLLLLKQRKRSFGFRLLAECVWDPPIACLPSSNHPVESRTAPLWLYHSLRSWLITMMWIQ